MLKKSNVFSIYIFIDSYIFKSNDNFHKNRNSASNKLIENINSFNKIYNKNVTETQINSLSNFVIYKKKLEINHTNTFYFKKIIKDIDIRRVAAFS